MARHDDPALAAADHEHIGDWAQKLGFAPLNRLWQLLLKGLRRAAREQSARASGNAVAARDLCRIAARSRRTGEAAQIGRRCQRVTPQADCAGRYARRVGCSLTTPPPAVEARSTASAALTIAQIHQLLGGRRAITGCGQAS